VLRTYLLRTLRTDVPTWDVVAVAKTDKSDAYIAVEHDIYTDIDSADELVAYTML
jgi:hypothetical protein